MPNSKISALPIASTLAGTELVEIVQAGENRRTTTAAIAESRPEFVSVKSFGAKGNTIVYESAVSGTAGVSGEATSVTVAGASFTGADVGKSVYVRNGSGSAAVGYARYATIQSVTSATTIVINPGLTATVTSERFAYGTLDHAAIEAAQAALVAVGGGTLYYPPGTYFINKAIRMRSKVVHKGAGRDATRLFNARSDGSNIDHWAGFVCGNTHPAGLYGYTYPLAATAKSANKYAVYPIANIAAGAVAFTLTTAADATDYAIGDVMLLFSNAGYVADNSRVPELMWWAKVVKVDAGTGTVTMDRRIPFAITSANAARLRNDTNDPFMGFPYEVISDVGVEGMTIDASNLFVRGGAFGCRVRDVRLYQPGSLVFVNGFVDALFEGCVADGWYWAGIEFKHGSYGCVVRDCHIRYRANNWRTAGPTNPVLAPLSIGEASGNILIDGGSFHIGTDYPVNTMQMIDLRHCYGVTIRAVDFLFACQAGSMLLLDGGASDDTVARDIHILDNLFRLRSDNQATSLNNGFVMGSGAAIGPRRVWIEHNTILGLFKAANNKWVVATKGDAFWLRGNAAPTGSAADIQVGATNVVNADNLAIT